MAFSDPEPPALNWSATPSPPGRLPGGFPAPALLARRPAPPTPRGARLPQLSGPSVHPSRPRSCILAPSPPSHAPAAARSRVCPRSPSLQRVLPTPLGTVRPSFLAAYAHAPPLPVPQLRASPAILLRRRFLLSLPVVEVELRHLPGGSGVPARCWGCPALSFLPPTGEAKG